MKFLKSLQSKKVYWREILAASILLLAIIFFRSERKEFHKLSVELRHADTFIIWLGVAGTFLYIFLQAGIYKKAFASVGARITWQQSIILFLKRNLISVFLPAGGVSSLAYNPSELRNSGFSKNHINKASAIYGFIGLASVAVVALPFLLSYSFQKKPSVTLWVSFLILVIVLLSLYLAVKNFYEKKSLYHWLEKKFPRVHEYFAALFQEGVDKKQFLYSLLFSVGVEFTGVLHIYVAMLALHMPLSLAAACTTYILSVLLMIVSPFLRGLGAVEMSMVYIFYNFGYTELQALSITLIYRFFEFWLPLVLGILSYIYKGKNLLLRLAPVILIYILGIIDILSVLTPPIKERVRLLGSYHMLESIHASNTLVLFSGIILLITAAYLYRGQKNAWLVALVVSALSLIGNLTKALDYEEAIIAGIVIITLFTTRKYYTLKSHAKWVRISITTFLLVFASMVVLSFLSFYFINVRHFGHDFTWKESLKHTFDMFLLIKDDSLVPVTHFGKEFITITRGLGLITWCFFIYMLLKPSKKKVQHYTQQKEKVALILSQYGNSPIDHFKLKNDKLYFFSDSFDAFVAYRIANGFAVVLEEPVCDEDDKADVLLEFEEQCHKMGLKTAFYRVDESSIPWFNRLHKRKLKIGEEAIIDLQKFSLEGRDKKSLRNGLNSLSKKGYTTEIYTAPHSAARLQELQHVSDDWLTTFDKKEMGFSQGFFDAEELKHQPVIVLKDNERAIKAFLNIIPDYVPNECTYDLIRKTADAPGAAMDALIIKLIDYAVSKDLRFINLGLVPLTGLNENGASSSAEQMVDWASRRVKNFQHYKGLRDFKGKYATIWENKYLVYSHEIDLLKLPLALNKVMKPT